MASYILRKIIRRLPGMVIKAVPLPQPVITEGFGTCEKAGMLCREAGFKKVLVVTDRTLFSLGYYEKITDSLKDSGIRTEIFSNIASEPNVDIIEEGRKAALDLGADAVIALGGGAVLDSCKIIGAAAKMKRRSVRSLLLKFLPVFGKTLPIIAVPTTAGTGAEITVGAVITDTKRHIKASTVLIGLNIIHVILDSELTVRAPMGITCACGIDALSHGLEGAVASVNVSDEDKYKSMKCVKTVFENLPVLMETPDNADARQNMCRAALYGGNAINKQLAGYVHAVAHSVGAKYKLPHGNAIAMSLLPVMEAQKSKIQNHLCELSVYCGFAASDDTPEVAADKFLAALSALIAGCNFPQHRGLIKGEDLPSLVKMITDDSINYSAPVVFTKKEIIEILKKING